MLDVVRAIRGLINGQALPQMDAAQFRRIGHDVPERVCLGQELDAGY